MDFQSIPFRLNLATWIIDTEILWIERDFMSFYLIDFVIVVVWIQD